MRCGQKEVILHCRFFFIFPHILIINDKAGWLLNPNFVNNMILVNNKCGVRNGRTRHREIRRINRMREWRLREQVHVTNNKLAIQICIDIQRRWGGRM